MSKCGEEALSVSISPICPGLVEKSRKAVEREIRGEIARKKDASHAKLIG